MKNIFSAALLPAVLFSFGFFGLIPSDLTPRKGCELWSGTASGNDPSVRVQLSLCNEKDPKGAVSGVLQWSSERSGWSRRAITGAYASDGGHAVLLRDTKFIENKPNLFWRFCLIDQYQLVRDGETLRGEYYSAACKDRAQLSLDLVKK